MIDNFDTDKWTVLCPGEPHLLRREDGLLCIRDSRTNQKVFLGREDLLKFAEMITSELKVSDAKGDENG